MQALSLAIIKEAIAHEADERGASYEDIVAYIEREETDVRPKAHRLLPALNRALKHGDIYEADTNRFRIT